MAYTQAEINALPESTVEELKYKLAAQLEFTDSLGKTKPKGQLTWKVSEKGAISIYGVGQYPLTQYPKNMLRILDAADEIRAFIEEHRDEFSWEKPAKAPEEKYTAEQRAADTRIVLNPKDYSAEVVAFATGRLNTALDKRFGTK